MANKENKDTVLRFWQEVFNERKLEQIDKIFTEDYIYHGAAGQDVRGGRPEAVPPVYFNAFPDLHAEVEDIFGEGDKILSRAMCRGTHKGNLMGMPPTGKQVAIRVIVPTAFQAKGSLRVLSSPTRSE